MSGSSFLSFGLTYWEGVGSATAGFFLVSIFMALNGRPGAFWHIPFPVAARASWGVIGFGFASLNRAFMACFWNASKSSLSKKRTQIFAASCLALLKYSRLCIFAVNTASGAQCLYTMIYAVFPSIANAKNTMSSGSALNSAEYGLMYIFVLLTGAMSLINVRRWHLLVYAKIGVFALSAAGTTSHYRSRLQRSSPFTSTGMIAIGVKTAGGVGPVVSEPSKLQGSEKSWLILQLILTSAASCSTFASNASDWQKNARRPNDPILGQLVGFPLSNFVIQSIGMLIASTSAAIYGEVVCALLPCSRASLHMTAQSFALQGTLSSTFNVYSKTISLLDVELEFSSSLVDSSSLSYTHASWKMLIQRRMTWRVSVLDSFQVRANFLDRAALVFSLTPLISQTRLHPLPRAHCRITTSNAYRNSCYIHLSRKLFSHQPLRSPTNSALCILDA